MRGVPLKVVGHAIIEMPMRHAHLSPEVKQDAERLLDGPVLERGNRGAMAGS